MAESTSFVNRRIHSLLGVVPIGLFLLEHLLSNYYSTRGPAAFREQVEWIQGLPFVYVLEIVFIFLPILFHAVYGLYIVAKTKNNVSMYGTFRNYMFLLQRITGVITLVYIVWHVYQTRFQVLIGNVETAGLGSLMNDILTNPLWMTVYMIGLLSTTFHFSNGLWSFLVSWGITVGPRAQRVATYACFVVFILISYVGIRAILGFLQPEFVS